MNKLARISEFCICVLTAGLGNLVVNAGDASEIDAILQRAVSRGDVPGVVAMAATSQGIIYQGAFGKRNVTHNEAMTLDYPRAAHLFKSTV